MTIPEQITYIYTNLEYWHNNKLSEEQANLYHERLLVNGNILTYVRNDKLYGYLEYWRISSEQLGRIVLGVPILTDVEDISNGPICYINNTYIDYSYRNGEAFEMLSTMLLVKNRDAEFFVACRNNKHAKPIKVYSRNDLIKLYTKGV